MGEERQSIVEQANRNGSERRILLADLAKKIQALDNPVKLDILSLLVESGALSVTDIAKKLNINFSTAHKYLESLESAELVTSKQVAENRLKRMFFVKDFRIELSPKSLFQKSAEANNHKPKFRLFDNTGKLVDFDEEKFSQKYIKRGMPRGMVISALQKILPQTYDGITLWELRALFGQALGEKANIIHTTLETLEKDAKHKRTFAHVANVAHPDALEMHAKGDIFIRNLGRPKLLNFVQSFDRISVYGITGKKPENLKALLQQTLTAFEEAKKFVDGAQAIDSFNYILAPFINKKENWNKTIEEFFAATNSLNMQIYIGLEAGKPRFRNDIEENSALAAEIFSQILGILKSGKFGRIIPVIKVWDKKILDQDFSDLGEFLLVNMSPTWQTENASFVGNTRFDSVWRGTLRTDKIGEAQEITLNLPRIAARSKGISEFLAEVATLTKKCGLICSDMVELTMGEFMRTHNISMPSEQTGRWTFVSVPDLTYAISFIGLPEAIEILAGKFSQKEMDLAKKILLAISQNLTSGIIRFAHKACNDGLLAKRFKYLDNQLALKTPANYSVDMGNIIETCALHEAIPGGHKFMLDRKGYKTYLATLPKLKFGTLHIT